MNGAQTSGTAANELLAHLDSQVESAERLLATVAAQTEAIKTQDVPTLLVRLGDVQTELGIRKRLELERERLIQTAAIRRNVPVDSIDFDALLDGFPAELVAHARSRGKHLREVLAKVARVHSSNRVLIRQELAFINHLLGVLSGMPQPGYSPAGTSAARRPITSVDARA